MPSGEGRRNCDAEAQGGAAEEGALDEALARRGLAERAGAIQRQCRN
jgi:hypothetical protein